MPPDADAIGTIQGATQDATQPQAASATAPDDGLGPAAPSGLLASPYQALPAAFASLTPTAAAAADNDITRILDLPVRLSVEIGCTSLPLKNIMQLAQGSVIELQTIAGEPMDVLINTYLIAQGEVVVVNERFGIRLTDIVSPSERLRRLNRQVRAPARDGPARLGRRFTCR